MRIRGLFSLVLVTGYISLISGCASQTYHTSSELSPNSIMGDWIVTDTYPSGREDPQAAALAIRGRRVLLNEHQASDPSGRICPTPNYQFAINQRGSVLGYREGEMDHAAAPTATIQVFCDTEQPFLSLIALEEGMLLLADGSRWLRLERADNSLSNAVAISSDSTAIAFPIADNHTEAPLNISPVLHPSPEISVSHAPASTSRNYLYLASYHNENGGRHAWELFHKAAPALANMQLVMTPIQIPGRGNFVRVYAAAANDQDFRAICQQLHKLARDCGSPAMRWKENP